MIGKICGTGSYAPSNFMDNNDLAKIVDTNDEWIRERTGIAKRHIIEDDTTVTMAAKAAEAALQNANIAAEEIDLILVSTISSNVILPCTACEVQRAIGAVNATGFDLNAACTGFLFAYNTAQAYIASGTYKTALIIGAELIQPCGLERPRNMHFIRRWSRGGSSESGRGKHDFHSNALRWKQRRGTRV